MAIPESTSEKVLAAIEAVTGEPAVRKDQDIDLFEYHVLDSLLTVHLLVTLNERFGTRIAITEIGRDIWSTPKKIIAFMEERVAA